MPADGFFGPSHENENRQHAFFLQFSRHPSLSASFLSRFLPLRAVLHPAARCPSSRRARASLCNSQSIATSDTPNIIRLHSMRERFGERLRRTPRPPLRCCGGARGSWIPLRRFTAKSRHSPKVRLSLPGRVCKCVRKKWITLDRCFQAYPGPDVILAVFRQ